VSAALTPRESEQALAELQRLREDLHAMTQAAPTPAVNVAPRETMEPISTNPVEMRSGR
jgi:hypothetical protein